MRVLWISLIAIAIDQFTKVLVVNKMYHSQSIPVLGDWLKLTYTENPGMAFGISFGPPSMITIFSIIATTLILLYLLKVRTGYLPYRASIGLVLGGAFGNIIDRVFYGAIFYDNPFFRGRVVDFIHVDAWRGFVPEWIPFMGGKMMALFPIWNVADMAIVAGVVGILTFQNRFHDMLKDESEEEKPDVHLPGIDTTDGMPAVTSTTPVAGVNHAADNLAANATEQNASPASNAASDAPVKPSGTDPLSAEGPA